MPRIDLKTSLSAVRFYLYNHWWGRLPGYRFRSWYLRTVLGIRVGKGTAIHMGCFFTGNTIGIGKNSVINRGCFLDGRVGIEIGNNVSISPQCVLLSLSHDPQAIDFATVQGPLHIHDRVWLGFRALIVPGVTIGEGAVVGAGSVVTRDVDPYTITAGCPAKKIGSRTKTLDYTLEYFPILDTDILPRKKPAHQ